MYKHYTIGFLYLAIIYTCLLSYYFYCLFYRSSTKRLFQFQRQKEWFWKKNPVDIVDNSVYKSNLSHFFHIYLWITHIFLFVTSWPYFHFVSFFCLSCTTRPSGRASVSIFTRPAHGAMNDRLSGHSNIKRLPPRFGMQPSFLFCMALLCRFRIFSELPESSCNSRWKL